MSPRAWTKVPTRAWYWWPLLVPVLVMALTCVAVVVDVRPLLAKPDLERAAFGVAATAAAVATGRLAVDRHAYRVLLALLALSFFLREIHWDWTTKAVYAAIAALGVAAIVLNQRIGPYVDRRPHVRVWLVATAATYVMSQFVARRGLQHLVPGETGFEQFLNREVYGDPVFSSMEEALEVAAHCMLLVTALVGGRQKS